MARALQKQKAADVSSSIEEALSAALLIAHPGAINSMSGELPARPCFRKARAKAWRFLFISLFHILAATQQFGLRVFELSGLQIPCAGTGGT